MQGRLDTDYELYSSSSRKGDGFNIEPLTPLEEEILHLVKTFKTIKVERLYEITSKLGSQTRRKNAIRNLVNRKYIYSSPSKEYVMACKGYKEFPPISEAMHILRYFIDLDVVSIYDVYYPSSPSHVGFITRRGEKYCRNEY